MLTYLLHVVKIEQKNKMYLIFTCYLKKNKKMLYLCYDLNPNSMK